VQRVKTESKFMQELAGLIRRHRGHMDDSLMAGDLERSLAALDEGMLTTEFAPPPMPRGEAEVDIRPPLKPIKLDDSRPVTAALEDRDHRIAQLEATVKDLMAKMNK
jgi:hypothetical protein